MSMSAGAGSPDTLLAMTEHRSWPLPAGPWRMRMSWRDLLFAHWPLPPEALRPLIPAGVPLDLRDGAAWVSVVPFAMADVAPRGFPAVPWLSNFLELNLRTYVTLGGKPGVWFFSLDAANPVAVEIGRRLFHLSYVRARMTLRREGDWCVYESHRTDRRLPSGEFKGRYRAVGPVVRAEPGSLDAWLTERYAFYTADRRGRLLRCDIHHQPWPLQPGDVEIARNTLADGRGFALAGPPPRIQVVQRLDVLAWGVVPAR
jgi:uncharacterized protein YqjF (DUF2071 family)